MHEVYTDGGCKDEIGAWAYVHINRKNDIAINKMVKAVDDTTNNRMEMIAIIRAIELFQPGSEICIHSDSGYVVHSYYDPRYLDKWVMNGWKTSKNKPVENQDLWQAILRLRCMYRLLLILIPGHSTDRSSPHKKWNDMVDQMCTRAIREYNGGGVK